MYAKQDQTSNNNYTIYIYIDIQRVLTFKESLKSDSLKDV